MFTSNSYMDPYLSHSKEPHAPHPNFPFYTYPFPIQHSPSPQIPSFTPFDMNPNQSNNPNYPSGYYPFRYPPYPFPDPNFANYCPPYFPNYHFNYPQFEPGKSNNSHCCGCPNHVCHQRQNPSLRNEEKKPESEERKLPNYPYPFLWYSPNKENEKVENDKGTNYSWPIIWMPEEQTKETKDQNANKRVPEETSKPNFKIIPLKFIENGNQEEKKESGEKIRKESKNKERENHGEGEERKSNGDEKMKKNNGKLSPICLRVDKIPRKNGSHEGSKDGKVQKEIKVIDVKSESKEKDLNEKSKEKKVDNVSVPVLNDMNLKEEKNKKEIKVVDVKSGNEGKDDLNANSEEKKKEIKIVDVKSANEGKEDLNANSEEKKEVIKEKKKEIKIVDVKSANEGKEDLNANSEEKKEVIKIADVKSANEVKEDLNANSEEKKVENVNIEPSKNNYKRKMSEMEAAVLIQAVYRGYNVRRWDPLEKLKKIRGVSEKARELRTKLQNVDESNKELEKKEKLVLSETMMNLLLQLDTIQGLHPSVREARKSVARELVSLQEKLDSVVEKQNPALEKSEKQDSGKQESEKQDSGKQVSEKQGSGKQESEKQDSDYIARHELKENLEKVCGKKEESMEVAPEVTESVVPETENPDKIGHVEKIAKEANDERRTERKLVEENEKLRETLEKLLEVGRNQLGVITGLNERVGDLEKKLGQKKKKNKRVRVNMHKSTMPSSLLL